jgi:cation diffusion facilitator family transporter
MIVIVITAVMMVVEIGAGLAYGSMALLADGLHMASHAAALGIAAFAYIYARRHAHDNRFSFGTGKVNALAGFTGALLLALFALIMAWESVLRLVQPVAIEFSQAIFVAVLGLLVNGISMLVLGPAGHHPHEGDEHPGAPAHDEHHPHDHHRDLHHGDHNLRAAYLHVLADALTSVLAIVALLAAKFLGWRWMDPLMGIIGAVMVARWSWGLLRTTSGVLLDHQAPLALRRALCEAVEAGAAGRVTDLHLWAIGPGLYAAALIVVSEEPRSAADYKALLPSGLGLAHVTVEVQLASQPPNGKEN